MRKSRQVWGLRSLGARVSIPIVLILVFFFGSYAYIFRASDQLLERANEEKGQLLELAREIGRINIYVRNGVLTGDDSYNREAINSSHRVADLLGWLGERYPEEVQGFDELYEPFFESLVRMSTLYSQDRIGEAEESLTEANAHFENLSWMEAALAFQIDEAQTLERERIGSVILVIAVVGVAIAAFLLLYLIPFQVVRPIKRVVGELARMAEGDADLTQELPVISRDEIGVLSTNFNRFLASLAGVVSTIRSSVHELDGVGAELSNMMEQTSSAVREMSASIQSIDDQITRQTDSVSETSATVEQISSSIHSLDRSIEGQAEVVGESSASIEQMVANISSVTQNLQTNSENFTKLLSATEEGKTKLAGALSLIQDIAGRSDSLLAANSVIRKVSTETNLLAMNAAIEAAHAGEFGRGFAVVAEEIRSLAENAAKQSASISRELKEVKQAIDSVVVASKEVDYAFQNVSVSVSDAHGLQVEMREAMEEQRTGTTQVLEALEAIRDQTTEVRGGSSEIKTASSAVLEQIRLLKDASDALRQSMDKIATGTGQIDSSVNAVNEKSAVNRENINRVLEQVNRFKLHADA
ncbi:MAG: methyl-accepting chemotaxis protein [Spirochaeta sp.]|nr:methyl-accepting chemotaxis protein [Spirochaeta sp.]